MSTSPIDPAEVAWLLEDEAARAARVDAEIDEIEKLSDVMWGRATAGGTRSWGGAQFPNHRDAVAARTYGPRVDRPMYRGGPVAPW